MSFNPRAYKIGDTVNITFEMVRKCSGFGMVHWQSTVFTNLKTIGVIVGIAVRQNGTIYSENVFDGGAPYFAATSDNRFWMIRFGLMNKPIYAEGRAITRCKPPQDFKLPVKTCPHYPLTEAAKQALSKDVKSWPRDEKGRWINGSCIHVT